MFVVTSDRISSHDFVLSRLIAFKGEVLNGVNVFMRQNPLRDIAGDVLASGANIDNFLPSQLRGDTDLQRRATVVKRCVPVKFELIPRAFITGSMWREYHDHNGPKEGYEFCGHFLRPGLHDGSRLERPIFTASTKAESGHDENINWRIVDRQHLGLMEKVMYWYSLLFKYLEERGFYLADTKFEVGIDGTLLDEVATPDASRIWRISDHKEADAQGRAPSGFDKEPTRKWASSLEFEIDGRTYKGLGSLDPTDERHIEAAHAVRMPASVAEAMTQRYLEAFEAIAGQPLDRFQEDVLGVRTAATV